MVGIDVIVVLIWLIVLRRKLKYGYYVQTDDEQTENNEEHDIPGHNNLELTNPQSLVWIRLKNYTAERAIDYSLRLKANRL